MKIIKRGQLAIISVALMVMVAAYVNYKYNPEREKDLGQTVFVNGKDTFTYDTINIYNEQNKQEETKQTGSTNVVKEEEDVLATFKHQRDSMFSELTDNYNKIINNSNTNAEQVNDYQNKLNTLIEKKHLISMVEQIIKANGVEDIAIVPTNNGNINVIIKTNEEIGKDKIASIQSTIQDEFSVDAKQITISCKKPV